MSARSFFGQTYTSLWSLIRSQSFSGPLQARHSAHNGDFKTGRKRSLSPETSETGGSNPSVSAQ